VRNSIILVDFIELRVKDGMALEEAVVDAGAVRFRPMALTAAAVIVGSAVILFDPIFQGLAVSLMAGEVASAVADDRANHLLPDARRSGRRSREPLRPMKERCHDTRADVATDRRRLRRRQRPPVGLNLAQSAFTNWCPMMTILRRLGVRA
jgi:hypothetical protein